MFIRLSRHVFLHIGLLFMAGLSFFSPYFYLYWATFFSALLHECCHLFVSLCFHIPIRRLELLPYGCALRLSGTDYAAEAYILIAGPLGSFLLCCLFYSFHQPMLSTVNLCLMLVNLLPAMPLDGGRLLRLHLWKTIGYMRGNRLIRHSTRLFGIFFLCLGLIGSASMLAIGAVVLSDYLFAPSPTSPLVLKKAFPTKRVKTFCVKESDSLLHLLSYYSPLYFAVFHVKSHGQFLPEATVTAYIRAHGATSRVGDLL
ncbi:MAG: hypothetical protein PUB07_01315 [Clostridia bacterium]|nr:hypothetical protein [Clostridia bacterium]